MIEFNNLLEIESTEYYPLVYIPNCLKKTLSDKQFYKIDNQLIIDKHNLKFNANKPTAPSKPSKFKSEYYQGIATNRFNSQLKKLIVSLIILFLFIIFLIQIILDNDNFMTTYLGLYLLFIGPFALVTVIIIWDVLKKMHNLQNDKIRKSRLRNKTEIEILNDNKRYEESLRSYRNGINTYETMHKEFVTGLEKYKDEYIYEKYLQEIKSKITISRSNDFIKKGKSEDNFLKYLLNRFQTNELMINIAVNTFNSAFYPDFLYVSKNKKFSIDIEIDERYDYETKKPIHFIGSDDERNNFFLDKNCFIIRFTEDQVTEEPEKCCQFIQDFVNIISRPQLYGLKNNIRKIKPWSYEEAYLHAKEYS